MDCYAKIETGRLDFLRFNQTELRAENYHILEDQIHTHGNSTELGQLVILLLSFTGGSKYLQKLTQDACAYIRKFGRPE